MKGASVADDELPLTDSAIRLLRHVRERARNHIRVHGELTTTIVESLTIATILTGERKVGRAVLEHFIPDVDVFLSELQAVIDGHGRQRSSAAPPQPDFVETGVNVNEPWVVPIEQLLSGVRQSARTLQHAYLGTEHFLMAAVSTTDPMLLNLLAKHGLETTSVEQAVRALLMQP
ncbi:MAG: Clp protease N-terminal domain-containing protein [Planctomycetaceae bacterium]|nr:Clp protease N-terminal domain-containing protein [Planctomycetaceae bacterium]